MEVCAWCLGSREGVSSFHGARLCKACRLSLASALPKFMVLGPNALRYAWFDRWQANPVKGPTTKARAPEVAARMAESARVRVPDPEPNWTGKCNRCSKPSKRLTMVNDILACVSCKSQWDVAVKHKSNRDREELRKEWWRLSPAPGSWPPEKQNPVALTADEQHLRDRIAAAVGEAMVPSIGKAQAEKFGDSAAAARATQPFIGYSVSDGTEEKSGDSAAPKMKADPDVWNAAFRTTDGMEDFYRYAGPVPSHVADEDARAKAFVEALPAEPHRYRRNETFMRREERTAALDGVLSPSRIPNVSESPGWLDLGKRLAAKIDVKSAFDLEQKSEKSSATEWNIAQQDRPCDGCGKRIGGDDFAYYRHGLAGERHCMSCDAKAMVAESGFAPHPPGHEVDAWPTDYATQVCPTCERKRPDWHPACKACRE